MSLSPRLLHGDDREAAQSLEDRDAQVLDKLRADLYAERVYVPTPAAHDALRQERRERVFLTVLALALVAWVVFLTAAYLLLDRAVS